jgi:hypothetical protein
MDGEIMLGRVYDKRQKEKEREKNKKIVANKNIENVRNALKKP